MTEGSRLTPEERKSLTHGEFWIPEREREVYREALESLNEAGVPYVVSGMYAIHAYTGIYRETKDLDLLLEPGHVVAAAEVLRAAGFAMSLKEDHWLGQGHRDGAQVDLIFGMANGIGFIDELWYRHSRPAILAAAPVRMAPPEELIWHRLYIGERHRFDMADVVHLIVHRGQELDWDRILTRVGEDWRLLLSQLHFFDFAYPGHRDRIPGSARDALHDRATRAWQEEDTSSADRPSTADGAADAAGAGAGDAADADRPVTRGTLLSRYSFAIDVNEWGFRDARLEKVAQMRGSDEVAEIRSAEVWNG